MSKNRIVTCTVINNTSYALTYVADAYEKGQSGSSHGVWVQDPVSSIPGKGQTTEAFSVERDGSLSAYGSTGWVSYNLNNNQGLIVFMFNNPDTYVGPGNSGNCWFYAVIQGYSASNTTPNQPVGTPLNVYAVVTGFDFNVTDPTNEDTMNITVTINSTQG